MDGGWTSCGRAGAAEIAWEEGSGRAVCGRAGAAEIAWEEARDGGARLKVDGLEVQK